MDFRTEFTLKPRKEPLVELYREVLLLGSCFAEYMGRPFASVGWETLSNPCGVYFNPASISRLLTLCGNPEAASDALFELEGRWRSWDFPTRYEASSREELLDMISGGLQELHRGIERAGTVVLTLGTAILWERESRIVANCHKVPAKEFTTRLLTPTEVAGYCREITDSILRISPEAPRIIWTVSPVRHVRSGFHENALSKATLLLGIEEHLTSAGLQTTRAMKNPEEHLTSAGLQTTRAMKNSDEYSDQFYFPSFEIMNDDLRDYRFYGEDLVHPSPMAVEYIFGKFLEFLLPPSDLREVEEGKKIRGRLAHRPQNPDSDTYRRFRQETDRLAATFRTRHPRFRP